MQDTITTPRHSAITALVAMVAAADAADDLLVSSTRFVDALLDARAEVDPAAVPVVDDALRACAHRHVVPTEEAVELVAAITAGQALEADPV